MKVKELTNTVKVAIFEIITKDKVYKIYPNGIVEGFPNDSLIINRIPIEIAKMISEVKSEVPK